MLVGCRRIASGRSDCVPDREGARSQQPVIGGTQQVAPYAKKILDDTVEGEKALGLASRFESAHVPFSLASRLMRNFGAIVGEEPGVVSRAAQNRSR